MPDGKVEDVKAKLKKVEVAGEGNKKVAAYQLTFKPEKRGDHIVVFTSPAVTIEGEKLPVFDTVKVVLHVQTQNGWESRKHGKDRPSQPYSVDKTIWASCRYVVQGHVFSIGCNQRSRRRSRHEEIPRRRGRLNATIPSRQRNCLPMNTPLIPQGLMKREYWHPRSPTRVGGQ